MKEKVAKHEQDKEDREERRLDREDELTTIRERLVVLMQDETDIDQKLADLEPVKERIHAVLLKRHHDHLITLPGVVDEIKEAEVQ